MCLLTIHPIELPEGSFNGQEQSILQEKHIVICIQFFGVVP